MEVEQSVGDEGEEDEEEGDEGEEESDSEAEFEFVLKVTRPEPQPEEEEEEEEEESRAKELPSTPPSSVSTITSLPSSFSLTPAQSIPASPIKVLF